MKNDNRTDYIKIRLTNIEKQILINEAEKREITVSDMIRGILNKEFGKRIFKKVG